MQPFATGRAGRSDYRHGSRAANRAASRADPTGEAHGPAGASGSSSATRAANPGHRPRGRRRQQGRQHRSSGETARAAQVCTDAAQAGSANTCHGGRAAATRSTRAQPHIT